MTGYLIPLLPYGRIENVLFRAKQGFASETRSLESLREEFLRGKEAGVPVVFPSHFFEYKHAAAVVTIAQELGLPIYFQISPGAELAEFFPKLLEFAADRRHFGVEVVFDHPFSAIDLKQLAQLKDRGFALRYLFCPTRSRDTLELFSGLPVEIKNGISLYFSAKSSPDDEFLSADEIHLLMRRLHAISLTPPVARYLHAFESVRDSADSRLYRSNPTEQQYLKSYKDLGEFRSLRALAQKLFSRNPLRLLLYVPWVILKSYQAIFAPVRNIRQYLPPVYWLLIYPIQKIYGVTTFQTKKRSLK